MFRIIHAEPLREFSHHRCEKSSVLMQPSFYQLPLKSLAAARFSALAVMASPSRVDDSHAGWISKFVMDIGGGVPIAARWLMLEMP